MILAVHQPQFCPWLGYFDKMRRADAFVVLDDVQFKKNEWQNRNKIKTAQGPVWWGVPVRHHHGQLITEIEVNNAAPWQKKLRGTLEQSYRKAPAFGRAADFLEELFTREWKGLVDVNLFTIRWLAGSLGVSTEVRRSSEIPVDGASTERLVNLCKSLGADVYLAGAGGRDYMDVALFEAAGIECRFQDYVHPTYEQLHGGFVSHLSALDLVLMRGEASREVAFA